MADDSFDAPSDYQTSSGGGGTNIWMWVGIGCGVILLLLAVALIFGGYKSYSCCKQAIERQKKARATALGFAEELRDGDYESAWSRTTDRFRERTSREQFQRQVEQYRDRLEGSVPEMVGFRRHMDRQGSDGGTWEIDIGFMPHAGETYIFMRLRLEKRGEGEELEFLVDKADLEERRRDVAAEPPARRVRRFNSLIDEGDPESARSLVADSFQPASSKDSFQSFLDRHDLVFGGGSPRFHSIQYERGQKASVLASHHVPEEGSVWVRYTMEKGGAVWMITQIEVGAAPPEPETETPAPAAPDAESSDTSSDATDVSGD